MSEPTEPDHSCEHLDEIIKIETAIMKECFNIRDEEEIAEYESAISEIEWYNGDIEKECEKAREIHIDLRSWGQYHKDESENKDCHIEQLEKENQELKDRNFMVANFHKMGERVEQLEKENAELSSSCEYALNIEQELLLVVDRITKLAKEEGAAELRTIEHIVKSIISFDLKRNKEKAK
jgi:hypothetical protein